MAEAPLGGSRRTALVVVKVFGFFQRAGVCLRKAAQVEGPPLSVTWELLQLWILGPHQRSGFPCLGCPTGRQGSGPLGGASALLLLQTSRWRTQGLGREGLSGSGLCSTDSCSVLALPGCCYSGPIDGLSLQQENVQEVLRQMLGLLGSLCVMSGGDRSFVLSMA